MNIAVCFKQVPDSSTRVRISDDGLQISEEGVSFVINPYDEFAISKAKELTGADGGEVTMITVGPDRVTPDIRKAMAQGGNKAIHLKTSDTGDVYSVAKVLAEEIKAGDYQLVLMGKQGIDDDMAQMAQILGEILGWGTVSTAVNLEINGDEVTAKTEIEGGHAQYQLKLPAVISAQRGLAEAIYPSLKALMQAKKMPVEVKEVSLGTPTYKINKMDLPPEKGSGKIFENGVDDVPELIGLLRNEAKVINN